MTPLEDRLRDAFRAAADTVEPTTVSDPQRQITRPNRTAFATRPRFLAPLAAAAAVAAFGATLMIAHAGHPPAPRPTPPATGTHPSPVATLPPYTLVNLGGSLTIYNTRAGTQIETLKPPAGQQFTAISSGGTARSFLVASNDAASGGCHAYFYLYLLGPTGQLSTKELLRSVPGSTPSAVAASPGGATFAYSTVHCNTATPTGGIAISGQAGNRFWAYDEADDYASSLAAPTDGDALVFSYYNAAGFNDVLLNTRSKARTVNGASRTLNLGAVSNTLAISPDGGTLYACSSRGSSGPTVLASYNTATGQQIHILRQWPAPGWGATCQVSMDATGRFLLVGFSPASKPSMVLGFDLRTGKSTTLSIHSTLPYHGDQLAW